MAFKKIVLQELMCCPNCGGSTGIYFQLRAYVKCINSWGGNPDDSRQVSLNPMGSGSVKTAICSDCNQRFEIIEKRQS